MFAGKTRKKAVLFDPTQCSTQSNFFDKHKRFLKVRYKLKKWNQVLTMKYDRNDQSKLSPKKKMPLHKQTNCFKNLREHRHMEPWKLDIHIKLGLYKFRTTFDPVKKS